jgi:hypothetical protein
MRVRAGKKRQNKRLERVPISPDRRIVFGGNDLDRPFSAIIDRPDGKNRR